jgi:DNA-binding NarL/FixJ family response regulator
LKNPDTRTAEPSVELQWPFVERRKADRRQTDRRRNSPGDCLLDVTARECTDREQQIVRLLLRGMTNKQIAQSLGIAEDTVKKHLQHVYKKLGVRRRALLIVDAAAAMHRPTPSNE